MKNVESLPDFLQRDYGSTLTRVSDSARCKPGDYKIKVYEEPWTDYRYFAKVQCGKSWDSFDFELTLKKYI